MPDVSPVFCDWLTSIAPTARHHSWLRHFLSQDTRQACARAYHHELATEYFPSLIKFYSSSPERELPSVLVLSGAALADMRQKNDNAFTNKVIALLARTSRHFSRIDLAIDIFDGGFLARQLVHAIVNGTIEFGRRSAHVVLGSGEGGGATAYIGARTSPLYLRIYDKAAESKGRILATRIEFELKGDWSKALAQQLAVFNGWTLPPRLFTGLLNDFPTLAQFSEIEQLMYGDVTVVHLSKRERLLETKDWLARQVLPTFLKDKEGRGAELWAWFKEKVEQS